jgi:hypothetical protein
MSTAAQSVGEIRKPWLWLVFGGGILLVWGAIAFPRFNRISLPAVNQPLAQSYEASRADANRFAVVPRSESVKSISSAKSPAFASTERKIVRTSSIDMLVQHPAATADKIRALAESLGGYLVSTNAGGESAATGMLTVRVPTERFNEARAEIRKLGLSVEAEKIEANDLTRQYVDQDASIRNLRAEEAQYLAILKQANTVKDMLAVTERLSEVRGQIEQQQAEFNALSRQVETVAITISLRTEAETKVFGLNWRPVYQLKLALRDGLESLANYATAMVSILFYLPAVLLWVGTILAAIVASWRVTRWVGVRWFGWNNAAPAAAAK